MQITSVCGGTETSKPWLSERMMRLGGVNGAGETGSGLRPGGVSTRNGRMRQLVVKEVRWECNRSERGGVKRLDPYSPGERVI